MTPMLPASFQRATLATQAQDHISHALRALSKDVDGHR
jgi:hypothetical protein